MLGKRLLLILLLPACQPFNGPPCSTCLGPYDLGLSSHRAALTAELTEALARYHGEKP